MYKMRITDPDCLTKLELKEARLCLVQCTGHYRNYILHTIKRHFCIYNNMKTGRDCTYPSRELCFKRNGISLPFTSLKESQAELCLVTTLDRNFQCSTKNNAKHKGRSNCDLQLKQSDCTSQTDPKFTMYLQENGYHFLRLDLADFGKMTFLRQYPVKAELTWMPAFTIEQNCFMCLVGEKCL